jgi:methyl-accepting chemotaxis protein
VNDEARSWTFGRKLGLGFAVVVGLTLALSAVAAYALRSVAASKDQVIHAQLKDLQRAMQLQVDAERQVSFLRGYVLLADEQQLASWRQAQADFARGLAELRGDGGEDARALLAALTSEAGGYDAAAERVVAARRQPDADLAKLAPQIPRFLDARRAIDAYVGRRATAASADLEASSEAADRAFAIVVATAGLTVLAAAAIALALGRSLDAQVGSAVHHIQSSSTELQSASNQQASATREQVAAMTEIGTTIKELLSTSRQIAEGAQRVTAIAEETAGAARSGDLVVRRTQEAITNTKRQIELVVDHMLALGKRSQQIGGVLELVSELLEQTNILAINATIEAIGAGEGGRRFAAVADEIRKLSDRVGASAKEIRGLVDEVRASVNTTVMATEGGAKAVDAGMRQFGELTASFDRINAQVGTTTEAAREIELSTRQQSSAVEQVNTAIANVSQSSRETEASATQTQQTASELATLSRELSRIIRAQAAA